MLTPALVSLSAGSQPPYVLRTIDVFPGSDELLPDEVLVKIAASGVCHTDLKVAKGGFHMNPPLVGGHEGSGTVESIGASVTRIKPGDSVVLSFSSCSDCRTCKAGHPAYCEKLLELNFGGKRSNGQNGSGRLVDDPGVKSGQGDVNEINTLFFGQSSFRKWAVVREKACVPVDAKSTEELRLFASLGCAIQTGASTILTLLRPPADSTIAIFGMGGVGLSAIIACTLLSTLTGNASDGYSPTIIIAIDPLESKREMAKSLGATHVFDPTEPVSTDGSKSNETGGGGTILSRLRAMLLSDGVDISQNPNLGFLDYAIDAVGNKSILEVGYKGLRAMGTLVTIGSPDGPDQVPDIPVRSQLIFGKRWLGCHQGDADPSKFIPHLVSLYRSGKFPLDKITTLYPYRDFQRALDDMKEGKCVKPILVFDDEE